MGYIVPEAFHNASTVNFSFHPRLNTLHAPCIGIFTYPFLSNLVKNFSTHPCTSQIPPCILFLTTTPLPVKFSQSQYISRYGRPPPLLPLCHPYVLLIDTSVSKYMPLCSWKFVLPWESSKITI